MPLSSLEKHFSMAKTLDQSQIDALFAKAQAAQGPAGKSARQKKVVPCDLRRSNQLTQDQVAAVTTLHESLARRLSNSLAAHLRVAFEMNLVSVEQLIYSEFLGRLPDLTYFASVHVMPIDARASIQLDIGLAYPIVDVALGGSGTETIESRDLTEIEEKILESVFRLMLVDLHSTWAPVLDLDFQFEHRQRNVQMHTTMQPGEKVLCLIFECHIVESSGSLAMVFPAVVANALLRRLSAQWSYSERIPSRDSRRRMREHLLDSRFLADLSLPHSALTIRELVSLEPGHVITLPQRAREPIHFNVAGAPMFHAYPVRHGRQRGAKIENRISLIPQSRKQQE
jgi:flagellar motor switch protein FliM